MPQKLRWLRRLSQAGFLLLFLDLLLRTEFDAPLQSLESSGPLCYTVKLFFQLDPLIAVSNLFGSHRLNSGLWLALLIFVPTLFLGRFFCSWICPMGTLNHLVSAVPSSSKRGKAGIEANRYKSWQTLKYYVLAAGLCGALFGTGVIGWLDPFSVLVRSWGLSFLPAYGYLNQNATRPLESSSSPLLQSVGEMLYGLMRAVAQSQSQPHFRQALAFGLIMIAILAANLLVTRAWCRALCPLGGLLGVISGFSFLRLRKSSAACNHCNLCLKHCQGGDDPIEGAMWRKSECHLCLNCVNACPHNSLAFRFGLERSQEISGPNLDRRQTLSSLGAGIVILPLLRSSTKLSAENHERLLRPPGSLEEEDFLSHCIRCGNCMKMCPNNSLQPALFEAGVEGLWTPLVVPRVGSCAPECVLCSQVCPTAAITRITSHEKGWKAEASSAVVPIRIGTAFYDRGRCLPWAMATDCQVCERACPVIPKAIYMQSAEVVNSQGSSITVKQPHLDPKQCVGCGACENSCPLHERPAIYVTSIGESRSTRNRLVVNGQDLSSR